MMRTLLTLTAALLFAVALPSAPTARAQDEGEGKIFTTVELKGWDLSWYDDKIRDAVLKDVEPRAGRSARRALAAATKWNRAAGDARSTWARPAPITLCP